jgi:signal peptidase I
VNEGPPPDEGSPPPEPQGRAAQAQPDESLGAPPAAAIEGSPLFTWGAGGAVVAGCVDLLVAVLLGILDPVAGEATRLTARDLGLPVGAAGLLSFGVAALAWRGRSRDLLAAAALQLGLAAGAWFLGGRVSGFVPKFYLATVAVHGLAALLAFAGASAAPGPADESRRRAAAASAGRAGAENLESILVAIVFALVIRHFAVEAYKIPTESMSPTLYGDSSQRGVGDRVLVAKWPALLGGPDRWQVWVFRPPLDRTINYVKRVVGLPGETIEIREGDLYVDGKVARKPPATREDMWFRVWPRPDGKAENKSPWVGEEYRKAGEDGFRVQGAKERRLLRWERKVLDDGRSVGGGDVGDVRVRFDVEDVEPGTEFVVRITGRGGPCEARIAADGSKFDLELPGAPPTGGAILPGGPVRALAVSFADLEFRVEKNGGEAVVKREVAPLDAGGRPSFGISFGVEKGGATFRDVRLDRDVFYTGSHRFEVPEGGYFFLGDNSGNSEDSRMWKGYEFRETAPGGRVFYSRDKPYKPDAQGRITFTDRNRVVRSYAAGEIKVSDYQVPLSFVPVEDLHGRAFAVFWPPRWFSSSPGGRVRFLP